MRRLLLVLGALAAVALLAWSVPLAADAIGALSETRIGQTRTPVPGAREAELESGTHTVFYEVEAGHSIDVPRLDIAISSGEGGPRLELDGFSGDLDITSGGRAATAIGSVRVPADGRYRIRVTSRAGAASPAVVLGRPLTGRIVRLVLAIAGAFAGLGLGALVVAIAIALRTRDARAPGT